MTAKLLSNRIMSGAGPEFHVRPAEPADAPALREIERAVVDIGAGVVLTPEDLGDDDARHEGRFAEKLGRLAAGAGCSLVAVSGQRLAGHVTLERYQPVRLRHAALLDLAVAPAFQGHGVGQRLLRDILAWAKSEARPPIRRIQANVLADNERAIHIYQGFGFEIEGTRKRFLQISDGSFVDDHMMALVME